MTQPIYLICEAIVEVATRALGVPTRDLLSDEYLAELETRAEELAADLGLLPQRPPFTPERMDAEVAKLAEAMRHQLRSAAESSAATPAHLRRPFPAIRADVEEPRPAPRFKEAGALYDRVTKCDNRKWSVIRSITGKWLVAAPYFDVNGDRDFRRFADAIRYAALKSRTER